MSERKKTDGGCVTRGECNSIMNPMLEDIRTIRNCLIGLDLKGGLVKDIEEMKSEMKSAHKESEEDKKAAKLKNIFNNKVKLALFSLVCGLVGYGVKYLIDKFG
jgi:hypothetical protein